MLNDSSVRHRLADSAPPFEKWKRDDVMPVNWRILNIDGHDWRLLRLEAERIVRQFYAPMIPLPLYYLLQNGCYREIIDGFALRVTR